MSDLDKCRESNLSEYWQRRYEQEFGEPWADLRDRVLARHPEFIIFENITLEAPKAKWWQFWKGTKHD